MKKLSSVILADLVASKRKEKSMTQQSLAEATGINRVIVDPVKRIIRHELTMDESSSVMEYLQIYMSRIVMCEQAAAFLKCSFDLVINGQTINNRP